MIKIKQAVNNNRLLVLVILIYSVLAVLSPDKAAQALKGSLYYVKEMLMIMPVILVLTSLITAWVPRKTIENSFGSGAGVKGSILSFLLGSFSAGPIYAAFPVCKTLLEKGAGISNIIIILSTWAVIKVPMLINEAKFLSFKFMIIRWILTTVSIFIMGFIMSRLIKREDIPMEHSDEDPQSRGLTVKSACCMGCGLCTRIAPDNFAMESKKAVVLVPVGNEAQQMRVLEAMEKCPAKAIGLNFKE